MVASLRYAAVIVLSLLSCGPAQARGAWRQPDYQPAAMLAAYLPIARATWPGSPCAGRETVHAQGLDGYDADASIDAFDAADHQSSAARADASTCTVYIRSVVLKDPISFCSRLVHEFGHLAGYSHPGEPGPQPPTIAQANALIQGRTNDACYAAIGPADSDIAGRAKYLLWAMLPGATTGGWPVIVCRTHVCHARGPGRRSRTYRYTWSRETGVEVRRARGWIRDGISER